MWPCGRWRGIIPASEREFARISGVGEKKLREFGEVFLGEIAAHLQTNPRQIFADDSFTVPASPQPSRAAWAIPRAKRCAAFAPARPSRKSPANAAVTAGTIYGHLAEGIERGEPMDLQKFFTVAELAEVAAAFNRNGFGALGPVFESLGGKIDYGRLRLFRAARQAKA